MTRHNTWIHATATVAVVLAGALAGVSRLDGALLVFAMGAVWSAEAPNTAVEALGDAVSRDEPKPVGLAKDVAAGAVLVAAVGAVVIACLVFWPHVARLAGQLGELSSGHRGVGRVPLPAVLVTKGPAGR